MGLADEIINKIKALPEEKQAEILDFIDFIEKKLEKNEFRNWSAFSIESAMRGMKDEESLYSLQDIKGKN